MSTFVKLEKLPDNPAKPDPAPRAIQPRAPRYNVELGRYLKKMEKNLCEGIAELWGGATVMKGRNAHGVAKCMREMWEQFVDPVAVGLDATRFDQHVSVPALGFEHSLYVALTPEGRHRAKLKRLLQMQLRNRGYARAPDGSIKYEVDGRRMSGDMNTGLGNCCLMSAMMKGFCEKVGLTARLANNGDDCVLVFERSHLGKLVGLEDYFLRLGFVMEIESPVFEFEKVDFCQTSPVWDGYRWVMVRNPWKSIDKDLVSVLDLGKGGGPKWADAVGNCGLAITGGIPVAQELYALLLRSAQPGKVADHPWMDGGFQRMAEGMDRSYSKPTPESRASFWRAFGILPDLQQAIEDTWRSDTLVFSAGVRDSPLLLIQLIK